MNKNYCVIGTGRQGTAAAYDLLKYADINNLLLLDNNQASIDQCLRKINSVKSNINIITSIIDFNDIDDLKNKLNPIDIFLSSVPYKYNLMLTQVALDTSCSMVDLGGHTGNVIKQLEYDKEAKQKGITIVPDCGMGPGMNVSMALLAIEQFDEAYEVRIWDGGLPRNPKEPWNYSLFFNIVGLTNEYDAHAFFIKDRKIVEVDCFEGYEIIDFGGSVGKLEASVTSGGLSTMPWTFEGKLKVLENKTLRYIGHWEWMKAYRQLGLFNEDKISFNGQEIIPRDFYHHLLEPQLDTKDFNDICIMRVAATGLINGQKEEVVIDAYETYDDKTQLMAMEKWTGWHASIVMQHIANKKISSGAFPIEKALSGKDFYEQAQKRNYKIEIK
jgi:lysine 6-dehydrogenase